MDDRILITIPWAVVVAFVLFSIALVTFLVAFVLWLRARRLQQEEAQTERMEAGGLPAEPLRRYCHQCGAEAQSVYKFCPGCGSVLH